MTSASPVNGVKRGESLAQGGPTCDANTTGGGRCKWPAGYGRDVEDPEQGDPCFMHAPGSEVCGAPVIWSDQGCRLPAGYGTDDPGSGPCHLHEETVDQDRARVKGLWLVAYDEFKTVARACEVVGVAERTVQVWRKMDEAFDNAVAKLQASLEERRVRAVEESMWERAVNGDASAAEVLFFLANRAPQRWQDLKRIQHDIRHSGGVLVVPGAPDSEEWGELAQRQQDKLREETGTGNADRAIEARVSEARDAE